MKYDQLINKDYYILQRNKKALKGNQFIFSEIANRINQSINNLYININYCLENGDYHFVHGGLDLGEGVPGHGEAERGQVFLLAG